MQTELIVISNRNIVSANGNNTFGEQYTEAKENDLRIATAKKIDDYWMIHIRPDKTNDIYSSEILFKELMEQTKQKQIVNNWVVFVHGFNNSFQDSLERAEQIRKDYAVNVLLYSWPSNPGGFVTAEYKEAKANAYRSGLAFDRVLEKLSYYMTNNALRNCNVRLNLMTFSLGNFLLNSYITSSVYSGGETQLFDNVILCQADVDLRDHADWTKRLAMKKKLYITLNEYDKVLGISDIKNPQRLGQGVSGLNCPGAVYVDFTGAEGVGQTHRMFDPAEHANNAIVNGFFQRALTSRNGIDDSKLVFNPLKNVYECAGRSYSGDYPVDGTVEDYSRLS